MMRTDARDRFDTPLEQRFTRAQIAEMMQSAGLVDVRFSNEAPYWWAVGTKKGGLRQAMCGLAGFWSAEVDRRDFPQRAARMAERIRHRGPDDSGTWHDEEAGLALAHQRLSILDLSKAGHQPIQSACGRYVMVFNGDIYNHLELRDRLEKEGNAPNWRGNADTETLLAVFVAWGIELTLTATVGMFALALWDRRMSASCCV